MTQTLTPVTGPGPDGAVEDRGLHRWNVPGVGGGASTPITAKVGRSTTIVGANGSGKSALGMWMEHNDGDVGRVRRIIAHRKLWFASAGPEITPAQRETTRNNMQSWSRRDESRYLDHAEGQRASSVLFDVISRVHFENSQKVKMYDAGASRQEVEAQLGLSLLDRLNAVFRAAGFVIELRLSEAQTLSVFNSMSNTVYPINQMSDGEKSALLLAGEVLTTPEGWICIIDEPERHLHRSISAGLVEAIIADRPDAHFVILTHDLELAAALGGANGQIYSLMSCTWEGQRAVGWELLPADAPDDIPENARLAILGGRRELLFIEGEKQSLDLQLYRLLFPNWTLVPAGGCEQVMRAVTGLNASQSRHWLHARGVVDGDGRTSDETSSLYELGILALAVSEVENLYYSDAVMKAVAVKQAEMVDEPADILINKARAAALSALREHQAPERLADALAVAEVRLRFLQKLPTSVDRSSESVTVSCPSPYSEILSRIVGFLDTNDLDGLIRLVPIRDTALRGRVSKSLGFQSHTRYEAAARVRIRDDVALAAEVRALAGTIPS